MRRKFSRISLVVYVILLVLSGFLLSTPGGYVEWFLVTGLFAIPPIVAGPKAYRILGSIGLAVALAAATFDYHAGKRWNEKIDKIRKQASGASQNKDTNANKASEPTSLRSEVQR